MRFDLSPPRPWEWPLVDVQQWNELHAAKRIWAEEQKRAATDAAYVASLRHGPAGQVG